MKRLLSNLCVCLSPPSAGKHWSCLQSLSQTSGHSPLDGPLGAQGQSEKDEAETVSAMASLSVDVEQPGSVPDDTETSRSAVRCGDCVMTDRQRSEGQYEPISLTIVLNYSTLALCYRYSVHVSKIFLIVP